MAARHPPFGSEQQRTAFIDFVVEMTRAGHPVHLRSAWALHNGLPDMHNTDVFDSIFRKTHSSATALGCKATLSSSCLCTSCFQDSVALMLRYQGVGGNAIDALRQLYLCSSPDRARTSAFTAAAASLKTPTAPLHTAVAMFGHDKVRANCLVVDNLDSIQCAHAFNPPLSQARGVRATVVGL
eukprot:m.200106 g.200106  ORF g.200106 m.200106 type:complete len:183 (+) comp20958_c0_seq1:448-996(+)